MSVPNSKSATSPSGLHLKICGMKYPENITAAAALQPDYLGFIFYEKSARFFDGTIPELPKTIKKVGVFVNASLAEIVEKIEVHRLDLVQLHGEETPKFCENLRHYDRRIGIIKAFSILDQFNFEQLTPYELACDYFLFDTKGKLPGGNGYTFKWNVLQNYPSTKPYFLSGGIGFEETENIKEFLQTEAAKHCLALDVNSKFELRPGLKSIILLNEFKNKIKPDLTGFENL